MLRSNVTAVQSEPSAPSVRARTNAWRAMGLPTPARRTGAGPDGARSYFLSRQSVPQCYVPIVDLFPSLNHEQ
ncbi:BQ5605_C005g03185 [Microbotryum silenes-dioicae]|uniref:BQ5605_C005g03185 protein n=1 Tax=Microbotryum silenes-dioicae TaxID=796604 RepID=A0A2X0MA12_9BASI|nr:BQ5605_C005g03185 [Microbotryum silenes-dioicae]